MPMTNLDLDDAIELVELLEFVRNWLAADPATPI
jgi:hypothetical protein